MGPSMHCVVAFLCAVLGSAVSNSEVAPETSQLDPNKLCEYGMKSIEKQIKGMTVPDQKGTANLPAILPLIPSPILAIVSSLVAYTLSGIHGQEGSCSNCTVRVKPDSKLEISFTNCNFNLNGKWAVPTGQGTFDVSVNGLSINNALNVTKNALGNPSLKMVNCSCGGGAFNVKLPVPFSKANQTSISQVAESLRHTMYNQACDEAEKVIAMWERN